MTTTARVTIDGEAADPDQSEMDIVYVPDRGGNSLKLQMFQGKYYIPYYRPSDMKAVETFDLLSDDVYISAFPRTGTHWTFEMTCMLLNGTAETIPKAKGRNQLELASQTDIGGLPRPRVLNTHMRLSDAPRQLAEKKCKIIYNMRDPKDVAVSLYNMYLDFPSVFGYHGNFTDFIHIFLDGKVDCNGIFEHYRDAEIFFDEQSDIPVHIKIYEETMKDPVMEVKRLSDFLELERNDDLCQAIADKCKFSKMKVDKSEYTVRFEDKSPLYRKGVVGDWQNWFTDEMLEDYYRVYDEKMAGSRFYDLYAKKS